MSIDRIGKGGGVGGPQGPGQAGPVGGKRAFEVGPTKATERAAEVGPAERVRSGELSLEGYLDVRVEEATRHLEGKLGAGDLGEIRSLLKDQLRNDPALRDMVKAATGSLPEAVQGGDEG
jgi:hypothetical protein